MCRVCGVPGRAQPWLDKTAVAYRRLARGVDQKNRDISGDHSRATQQKIAAEPPVTLLTEQVKLLRSRHSGPAVDTDMVEKTSECRSNVNVHQKTHYPAWFLSFMYVCFYVGEVAWGDEGTYVATAK